MVQKVERNGTLHIPFDGSGDKGKREDMAGDKRYWGVGNGVVADGDVVGNGIVIGSKLKEKKDAGSTVGNGVVAEDLVDGTEIGNGIVIGSK